MQVFITGGSGLVGKCLVQKLVARGDRVHVLSRRPEVVQKIWGPAVSVVAGDPTRPGPWQGVLARCDGVVNLAGEGVFNRRWTDKFKELMFTSRVRTTDNVVAALSQNLDSINDTGKVLINASAIGYYGPTDNKELTESSPAGNDTLGRLCAAWERSANTASSYGCRVVTLRIGVVLDASGGALRQMTLPYTVFVGGPVGSGNQFVSWIHIKDLVGLILFGLDNIQASGPINATAPNPVTNKELSTALGNALHRASSIPTPAFALRLVLGEVADLITKGQRVLPKIAAKLGYSFEFAEIETALGDIFKGAPRLR